MRRRSERGKNKPTKEDSPEKPPEKPSRSSRHSRRRRKSSSSSDSESKGSSKNIESSNSISQPLVIEVPKVETIPEESKAVAPVNSEVTNNTTENPEMPNREDATDGNSKEKEESLWKVQSANGAGDGGEIQKLKICRQRPTESPEIGDTALRRRLGRNAKESRSTDDSTQEESEKESKKSKHRSRTSSKNSPMVSPTVVCDVSGDSPTKIKIINVSHLNTDSKSGVTKPSGDKNIEDEEQVKKSEQNDVKTQEVDLANISLPETETPLPPVEMKDTSLKEDPVEVSDKTITERRSSKDTFKSEEQTVKSIIEVGSKIEKDEGGKPPPEKILSPVPSPKKDLPKPDSSGNSESSEDESKPRRVKKKRRRDLQSSVLRRFSGSTSPKQESSDSEEDIQKKKEADRRESTDKQEPHVKDTVMDEKAEEAPLPTVTKTTVEERSIVEVQQPMPRKRRWGSSKANRPEKPVSISTDILKSLIPDAKPVAADELQLSVEEEEGQLMDDDDEEDVVVLMAKEEEKQLELERLKEEKQKEREKEEEERRKKRQERQERFEKKKQGETLANKVEKVSDDAPRKILLLSDDVKKVSRPPTPPRRKPTSVLYITHLVRPFTVQQLKNLLLRTGTIAENGFWIDKIKSKCYVEYTTEDAAVETRHALHGVKWPTSNPKTLVVEFASHNDLAAAQVLSEESEQPRKPEPLNMVEGWVADQARIRDGSRRTIVREWDVGKPEHPDEALEYELKMKEKEKKELERKMRKERHHRTPSPETDHHARKARKKDDAPAKLLDDLFKKTKCSPCIYWLPLTQEQIAVKEEMRRQHMAEHERRLAEIKKADQARRDRERRSRK